MDLDGASADVIEGSWPEEGVGGTAVGDSVRDEGNRWRCHRLLLCKMHRKRNCILF